MTSYFLGIDIGATKTHAIVADETGRALGFARTGPGNYQGVGYPGMVAALSAATTQALARAGLAMDQIAGAGFGIAGYDWPSQRPRMLTTIQQALELRAPVAIANDAVLGLLAGTEAGWGVALVAGTSNNCRGRDRQGREGRITGDGSRFGEYGGAAEVAMKALHTVAAAWSRRGPATALSAALVAHLGARDVDDLLEGLALGRYRLGPDAAPLVFQVAQAGDPVAQDVIAWAGHELGDLAVGVIRQLEFERLTFDVVLVGSLFNGGAPFVEAVRRAIQAVAPGAHLQRLTAPPAVGAVLLGMERVGRNPAPARPTLVQTTTALLDPAYTAPLSAAG
ncbi:MAG TPA: BadF/BadG/BcrA/BcrD ATPase family protein [Chloroflexia bacterium]|nr:BadF/BadG/BcrA/BcrD ATPase family protein [Chloroflexia bacterium]